LLPQAEDSPDNEATQGTMRFSARLALAEPALDVSLGFGQEVSLGQHDSIEDGVQPPVTTAVEPVANEAGRGSLQWGDASIGRELSISREAVARSEDGSKGPCR